jgi:hypothetical protein
VENGIFRSEFDADRERLPYGTDAFPVQHISMARRRIKVAAGHARSRRCRSGAYHSS